MKSKLLSSLPIVLSLLGAAPASAATFNERCPDLATCANVVGDLLGQRYLFDPNDVKGKVVGTGNLELTKDNAEVLFTSALYMQGFSRIPLAVPGTYQILRQRDARDQAIPYVSCDQKTPPQLPDAWDLYTMKYKATNPEVVEDIARMSRSFMPANSRIIPAETGGMLLVTDSAPNLKKLYEIIRDNDQKLSPEARRARQWARPGAEGPKGRPSGPGRKSGENPPAPGGHPPASGP